MNKNVLETLGEGKYQYTKWQYTGIGVHIAAAVVSVYRKRGGREGGIPPRGISQKKKKEREQKDAISGRKRENIHRFFFS